MLREEQEGLWTAVLFNLITETEYKLEYIEFEDEDTEVVWDKWNWI